MEIVMYPTLISTVDVVLFTLKDTKLHVGLIQRNTDPYKGSWALPGGYVHPQEDTNLENAAQRILNSKTDTHNVFIEQLGTVSGLNRDPRGWSLSVVYYALATLYNSDQVKLFALDSLPDLAFDHKDIVGKAADRIRNKSYYSSLPVFLCGDTFTLPQLQSVYETLLGEPVDKVTFRRKIMEMDIIEETGIMEPRTNHRPAKLMRVKQEFKNKLALASRNLNCGG
jgi:8-oxo-dGTP diphosphatase